MRLSERNKQPIWYANYSGKTEIEDEYGNIVGDYQIVYTNPKKAMWNVGVIDSVTEVEMFGMNASDIIRVVPDTKDFSLDENSVLWYGITPNIKADGTTDTPYNYNRIKIHRTLNTITFYAQRTDIK